MGLKAKSYRFDDEVRAQIANLRRVYGTDNAGMRFVFGLSAGAEVIREIEAKESPRPSDSANLKAIQKEERKDSRVDYHALAAKGLEAIEKRRNR